MKVLLVATVQSHICQFHRPLVDMLHEHNYEVHVAARNNLAEKNGLKLDFVEKIFDIPFERSPFSISNINAYKRLKEIIDIGEYDIIHCNTPVGGVVGRLAARSARKKGAKVYYTAHGFHFYEGAPKKSWIIYYPIEKIMCRFTDKLITINNEDFMLAKKKFHVDSFRIHGIGARSDKYFPLDKDLCVKLRHDLGYDESEKLILCTGELNDNKNQITAIRAMGEVIKTVDDVKLLLAGNGDTRSSLEQAAMDLGIAERVVLLGYCTDLEKYINIADLIVSCSIREGLGMNLIEGMLCGKPVVASKNRGHTELVKNGYTGYLIEAKDVHGFADAITDMLSNPKEMKKMGKLAMQEAEIYKDSSVQKELERIYFGC